MQNFLYYVVADSPVLHQFKSAFCQQSDTPLFKLLHNFLSLHIQRGRNMPTAADSIAMIQLYVACQAFLYAFLLAYTYLTILVVILPTSTNCFVL